MPTVHAADITLARFGVPLVLTGHTADAACTRHGGPPGMQADISAAEAFPRPVVPAAGRMSAYQAAYAAFGLLLTECPAMSAGLAAGFAFAIFPPGMRADTPAVSALPRRRVPEAVFQAVFYIVMIAFHSAYCAFTLPPGTLPVMRTRHAAPGAFAV